MLACSAAPRQRFLGLVVDMLAAYGCPGAAGFAAPLPEGIEDSYLDFFAVALAVLAFVTTRPLTSTGPRPCYSETQQKRSIND